MAACGSGANYGSYGPTPQPMPMPSPDDGDCEDCVQVVKTTKRVRVPCHRNTYKSYTVKVPRQVTEQVERKVNYTDYESRQKQVPYTINRPEQRMRIENQNYQVPVQKCTTKMVSVTRKVPRTIYVDVTTQVPKQETTTVMENRTRQVKIPYTVNVPETRYRTENYQVPVQRTKSVYDNVTKTVYDTQVRTRCEPKVTYVTKEIPVYNVVARPPQPCPPGMDCGQDGAGSGAAAIVTTGLQNEFNSIDKNNDGVISPAEYAAARAPAVAQTVSNVAQAMSGGGYGGASTLPAPGYGGAMGGGMQGGMQGGVQPMPVMGADGGQVGTTKPMPGGY